MSTHERSSSSIQVAVPRKAYDIDESSIPNRDSQTCAQSYKIPSAMQYLCNFTEFEPKLTINTFEVLSSSGYIVKRSGAICWVLYNRCPMPHGWVSQLRQNSCFN
jgi:hypothetical protein